MISLPAQSESDRHDLDGTAGSTGPVIASLRIDFCAAVSDPEGKSTSGVPSACALSEGADHLISRDECSAEEPEPGIKKIHRGGCRPGELNRPCIQAASTDQISSKASVRVEPDRRICGQRPDRPGATGNIQLTQDGIVHVHLIDHVLADNPKGTVEVITAPRDEVPTCI